MAETEVADLSELSVVEQDAFALTQAGILMDQAREDPKELAAALDHNIEVWIAIRVMVTNRYNDNPLPQLVRENLVRLSDYVAGTTFKHGVKMPDHILATLININFQIAQGLLEGEKVGKNI